MAIENYMALLSAVQTWGREHINPVYRQRGVNVSCEVGVAQQDQTVLRDIIIQMPASLPEAERSALTAWATGLGKVDLDVSGHKYSLNLRCEIQQVRRIL